MADGALSPGHVLGVVIHGLARHAVQALHLSDVVAEVGAIGLGRRGPGHAGEHGVGHQEPPGREHARPLIGVHELGAAEPPGLEVLHRGPGEDLKLGGSGLVLLHEVLGGEQLPGVAIAALGVGEELVVVLVVAEGDAPGVLAALDRLGRHDLLVGQAPQGAVLADPVGRLEAGVEGPIEGRLPVAALVDEGLEGPDVREGRGAAAEVQVELLQHIHGIVAADVPALRGLRGQGRRGLVAGVVQGHHVAVAGGAAAVDLLAVGHAVPVAVLSLDGLRRLGQGPEEAALVEGAGQIQPVEGGLQAGAVRVPGGGRGVTEITGEGARPAGRGLAVDLTEGRWGWGQGRRRGGEEAQDQPEGERPPRLTPACEARWCLHLSLPSMSVSAEERA